MIPSNIEAVTKINDKNCQQFIHDDDGYDNGENLIQLI